MKKHIKKLLALLVCAMLLGGTFAASAEELEIELTEADLTEINNDGNALDIELLPEIERTTLENADINLDVDSLSEDLGETGTSIEENYASSDINGFHIVTYDDSDEVYADSYDGPGGFVEIPGGVTVIGDDLFKDRSDITGVSIPDTVKEIRWNAFEGTGITSIAIPNSVSTIGQEAFSGTALEEVTIPGSVKDMGMHAFRNCKSLKKATLLEGAAIGRYMFYGCDLLEYVSIPGNVEIIENQEFMEFPSLKTVVLGEGITVIEDGVFRSCPALSNITLPSTIETIGDVVFENCSSLKAVTLPKNLGELGGATFSGCTSLETVQFSDNLKTIGNSVFDGCTSLKRAILPQGLKTLKSNSFCNCTSLIEVSIPGSVKVVEEFAFQNCTSLEKVTIGEGVMALQYSSFMNCPKLLRITVPESVISIDDWALGCLIVDGWWGPHLEGFTICGKAGSEAERYANANGFEFDDGTIKPKSITITKGKSAEIEVGKTLQLKTTLKPSNAKTTLTWKSSNEDIATVSSKGLVKGVGKGKATITVTTANGKSAKITIEVIARKPSKVTITNGKKATVKVGKTLQLKTKLSPANAETKLTWTSSNKKVATVSSKGLVKGVKAGKAKITVKTANGKSATITITVK